MTTPSQYLLLLLQPGGPPGAVPPNLPEIMGHFKVWMDGLYAKGAVAACQGLENTGKIVRGPDGATVVDGPYAEAKEVIGGFVLINAAGMDEALAIARGCPGLAYGMGVEVRPVRAKAGG